MQYWVAATIGGIEAPEPEGDLGGVGLFGPERSAPAFPGRAV